VKCGTAEGSWEKLCLFRRCQWWPGVVNASWPFWKETRPSPPGPLEADRQWDCADLTWPIRSDLWLTNVSRGTSEVIHHLVALLWPLSNQKAVIRQPVTWDLPTKGQLSSKKVHPGEQIHSEVQERIMVKLSQPRLGELTQRRKKS
jgi:hypothetical protein